MADIHAAARPLQYSPGVNNKAEELKKRAAEFARRIGGLLIDAATSVSANYRATCRARSRAEFISKMGQVAEEADECVGWLELIIQSKLKPLDEIRWEVSEAAQLTAIFTASLATAKNRRRPARRDAAAPNPPIPE